MTETSLAEKIRVLFSEQSSDEIIAKKLAEIYKKNQHIFLQEIERDNLTENKCPFFILILHNHPKAAKVFLDILMSCKRMIYPTSEMENDKYSIFTKIINQKDIFGNTYFHLAIARGYNEIVGELIKYGADLSIRKNSEIDDTPLQHAVRMRNLPALKILLKAKCEVNAKNSKGKTALHMATENNDKIMVGFLLAYSANPHIRDKKGDTPLHLALYEQKLEMAELLLTRDYPIIENAREKTALDIARKGKFARIVKIIERKSDFFKEKIENVDIIPKKSVEKLPLVGNIARKAL